MKVESMDISGTIGHSCEHDTRRSNEIHNEVSN